jgi:hypothetical protein
VQRGIASSLALHGMTSEITLAARIFI